MATHGYERDGAYVHQLSTTYARTPSQRRMEIGFSNGSLFYARWGDVIRAEEGRAAQIVAAQGVARPDGWRGRGARRGSRIRRRDGA